MLLSFGSNTLLGPTPNPSPSTHSIPPSNTYTMRQKVIFAIYLAIVITLVTLLCALNLKVSTKLIIGCSAVGLHLLGGLYYYCKPKPPIEKPSGIHPRLQPQVTPSTTSYPSLAPRTPTSPQAVTREAGLSLGTGMTCKDWLEANGFTQTSKGVWKKNLKSKDKNGEVRALNVPEKLLYSVVPVQESGFNIASRSSFSSMYTTRTVYEIVINLHEDHYNDPIL
jgi:hypothetical protein